MMNLRHLPLHVLALASALLLTATVTHAEEPPVLVGDSMEAVLKLGPEELAVKLGNPSEAGLDRAARIWAAAKRIETEGRLAGRSVRRVMVLGQLRRALDGWQDLQLEIVSVESGGGTMWGHMMSRNDAELEKFLAGITDGLVIEEKDPEAEGAKALDAMLPAAEKWLEKVAKNDEFGVPDKEWMASIRERLKEAHAELKWAFHYVGNPKTAAKVLGFCREAMEVGKMGDG